MAVMQNKNSIIQVLGAIFQNPKVITDNRYNLVKEDFPEKFHQTVFLAMNNLVLMRIEKFDIAMIDAYLKENFSKGHKIFTDNNGMQWLAKAIMHCTPENLEYHYNEVKKYSLLRDLKEKMGLDISDIYCEYETDANKHEKLMEKFSKMTIDDIIAHYNKKWQNLKNTWNTSFADKEVFMAGDGIKELVARLGEKPNRGFPMINKTLSYMVGGMRKSKFYLISAPSGQGKSRYQVSNACYLSIPELYNVKTGEWEKNPHKPQKSTYISTELRQDEIQRMMIAYISAVDEHNIKENVCTPEETERVLKASDLLEKSQMNCIAISDFDISDIEDIVIDEAVYRQSGYIFFDYLHTTPKLMSYFSRKTGSSLAEHQVLYLFGNALKNLANKYDVFMYTSTQVNREVNGDTEKGAHMLRGSMSLADKCDICLIISKPTQKDIKMLDDAIRNTFKGNPDTCYTIFKNRGGKYKDVIMWTRMNLGNMREEVLFVTDASYKIIDVPEDNIKFDM